MASTALQARLGRLLRQERLQEEPWRFAYFPEFLPSSYCHELSALFSSGLLACERRDGKKPYAFLTGPVDCRAVPAASPSRHLLRFLRGTHYRNLLSTFTGVDLSGCVVSLDLWEYRSGHWLAPHVDKADKVVTQIIYLTQGWTEAIGGRLLILNGGDTESVAQALPPRLGASAIILRSKSSWHAVEPVSPGGPPRRSLTIMYRSQVEEDAIQPERPNSMPVP